MWFEEAVVYQIYPLGLCGAPEENDGAEEPRILRLLPWAEHIKKLGADTVLLNPVFDSGTATIPGTTTGWTPAWGPTGTWPRCAGRFTTPGCG